MKSCIKRLQVGDQIEFREYWDRHGLMTITSITPKEGFQIVTVDNSGGMAWSDRTFSCEYPLKRIVKKKR